jgi:hypothetical protein
MYNKFYYKKNTLKFKKYLQREFYSNELSQLFGILLSKQG